MRYTYLNPRVTLNMILLSEEYPERAAEIKNLNCLQLMLVTVAINAKVITSHIKLLIYFRSQLFNFPAVIESLSAFQIL